MVSSSRWTTRSVTPGYFLGLWKAVGIAVFLAIALGILVPKNDFAQVGAIGSGPLTILILGSRMNWYAPALFAAIHLLTLVLVFLMQQIRSYGLSYAVQTIDYATIGMIGAACVLGAQLIWIGLRVIRGTPVVSDAVCQACSYNLTGNVTGVCPECGNAIPVQKTA